MAVCAVWATFQWQQVQYNGQWIQSPNLLMADPAGHPAVSCPGYVLLDSTEYANYLAMSGQPFDYVAAGSIFAFFFSSVVGLWWVSKSAGTIIEAVRKW